MSPGFLSSTVPIVTSAPTVALYRDASLQGWGDHRDSFSASDFWTYSEKLLHINRLELEAAFRALRSFVHFLSGRAEFHDGCLLRQQGGGSSVLTSLCLDRKKCYFGVRVRGFLSPPGQTEDCSRCPQPLAKHSPHRVDSSRGHFATGVKRVVSPHG